MQSGVVNYLSSSRPHRQPGRPGPRFQRIQRRIETEAGSERAGQFCGSAAAAGAFLVAIGLTNPHDEAKMFGFIAGMAVFLEAGNGANFALVPHVHPFANGILSGITGAAGNLGGVVFAILFRFHGTNYAESFWIAGVMIMAMNLSVCWIQPLPQGQIGGR